MWILAALPERAKTPKKKEKEKRHSSIVVPLVSVAALFVQLNIRRLQGRRRRGFESLSLRALQVLVHLFDESFLKQS